MSAFRKALNLRVAVRNGKLMRAVDRHSLRRAKASSKILAVNMTGYADAADQKWIRAQVIH